jgi:hypothetical protein
MDEAKFARYGLLAGIVFVVLVIVTSLIGGSPPMPADSDQEITRYFHDNKDALRIGAYLGGLAGLVFLWFLGSLFGRLRAAEGGAGRKAGVALTGGVVLVGLALVANSLTAYAALHNEAASGFFRLSAIVFGFAGFAGAVFTSGVALVLWMHDVVPKWMGYAGEAIAVGFLLSAGAVGTENDTVAIIGLVVLVAWAIWLVALSLMLYRTAD